MKDAENTKALTLHLDGSLHRLILVFRPSLTARNLAYPSKEFIREEVAKLEQELAGLEISE